MSTTAPAPKIEPQNKQQLADAYGIGRYTLNAWLLDVPELGEYRGRCFTVAQVERIYAHLGLPTKGK